MLQVPETDKLKIAQRTKIVRVHSISFGDLQRLLAAGFSVAVVGK